MSHASSNGVVGAGALGRIAIISVVSIANWLELDAAMGRHHLYCILIQRDSNAGERGEGQAAVASNATIYPNLAFQIPFIVPVLLEQLEAQGRVEIRRNLVLVEIREQEPDFRDCDGDSTMWETPSWEDLQLEVNHGLLCRGRVEIRRNLVLVEIRGQEPDVRDYDGDSPMSGMP